MTSERRFQVDKLVRDKTKERLLAKKVVTFDRVMESAEYLQCLKKKLLEEAQEVVDAGNTDEYLAELADVLEVIHALAVTANLSYEQIELKRLQLKEARGGFEGRIYSAYIEIDADATESIEYCLKQPDKYPEIK